jgi:hypothetical protein
MGEVNRMPRRNLRSVSAYDFVRRVVAAFSTGREISLPEVEFAMRSAQQSAKPEHDAV